MADAFQKIKSSVNRSITTISVKTSSSLEKSKIKTHIESLEREIEKTYFAVGQAAYAIWDKGETDYSSLDERFASIKSKYAEIEELKAELTSIDDRDSQIFGTNVAPVEPESAAHKIYCSNCGAEYEELPKFCRKCGNKMGE